MVRNTTDREKNIKTDARKKKPQMQSLPTKAPSVTRPKNYSIAMATRQRLPP